MRKRINRITLLISLVCSLLVCYSSAMVVNADKIYIESEDKTYSGRIINDENILDYTDKELKIKNCDLNNPFIEFIINSSEYGTRTQYTPDFEKITFSFTSVSDKENKMTISVYAHYIVDKADEMTEKNIAINTAGGSQTLAAEYRGRRFKKGDEWITSEKHLSNSYGGNICQSFDGYIHRGDYIDENGNPIEIGANRAIRIFYDRETNALYTDVGRSDESSGGEPEFTRIEKNGVYRWRIRDFDISDYKDKNDEVVNEESWSGFEINDDVKFSVSFSNIRDEKRPSIMISKLCGEFVEDNAIFAKTPAIAKVGTAYKVPCPDFFDKANYRELSFISLGGKYKVEKKIDDLHYEPIKSFETYTNESTFMPDTEGEYVITYQVDNGTYNATNSIKVSAINNPTEIEICPNELPVSCYIGSTFDIGANALYPSQIYSPDIYLEIFRNSQLYEANTLIGENKLYTFVANGKYKLVYTCLDYIGRETRVEKDIDVQRYYLYWNNGISENYAVEIGKTVKTPSASDIAVFDILLDRYVSIQTCEIMVSYNGSEMRNLSSIDFSQNGEYKIQYKATYDAYGKEEVIATRNIYLHNSSIDEVIVNGLPGGTKLKSEIDNTVEINLKAIIGDTITIPYEYFNQTPANVILKYPDGTLINITEEISIGDYSFTPNQLGNYIIEFIAENNYYRAVKVLNIDVRSKWVVFLDLEKVEAPLGSDIYEFKPICKDYYGNDITNYTTKVLYMGRNVDGNTKLDKLGIYTIIYTYKELNELVEGIKEIHTFDNTEPIIILTNKVIKSYKNKVVKLADCQVLDDSGLSPKTTLTVKLNGENINIFNNSFYADKAGEYVVTYNAVDSQGNQITQQYVISVNDYKYLIIVIVMNVILLSGSIVLFILIIKKKKEKTK